MGAEQQRSARLSVGRFGKQVAGYFDKFYVCIIQIGLWIFWICWIFHDISIKFNHSIGLTSTVSDFQDCVFFL